MVVGLSRVRRSDHNSSRVHPLALRQSIFRAYHGDPSCDPADSLPTRLFLVLPPTPPTPCFSVLAMRGLLDEKSPPVRPSSSWRPRLLFAVLAVCALYQLDLQPRLSGAAGGIVKHPPSDHSDHSWPTTFPRPNDPFHFLPCTNSTLPPPISDPNALSSWTSLFDPNPAHWSFGANSSALYLCGYLDVPLDYTNSSDPRIVRLAITKFQHHPTASSRTIVVNPGGPGGSGTNLVWRKAERFSSLYSNSTLDVLGWDPRGVNATQPSISCFPFDSDRDRWSLLTSPTYRSSPDPLQSMLLVDAYYSAILNACAKKYDDIPTMLSTAFVARDVEEIRKALNESHLSGYFVSYGTGIGQTYANMFPDKVGRLMLDGTEYVRDHREMGGFGWTALDNVTAAFEDGFVGECVAAGPGKCALANPLPGRSHLPDGEEVLEAMDKLFKKLIERPVPGWTKESGPMIITYSSVISLIYSSLYSPFGWPALATAFHDLLHGNSTMISRMLDQWDFDPAHPSPPSIHSSDELGVLVICADQYDSPLPPGYHSSDNGESWYLSLWKDMVHKSEFGGNGRFLTILPCRHYNSTFSPPKEVYRGPLNHSLSNPVLLIAESYDPATPLRNGRRLLQEMGGNARLIAHHGYGHSSRDTSSCTDAIMRSYMMEGKLPKEQETECWADKKPYRYDDEVKGMERGREELLEEWSASLAETKLLSPKRRF